MAEWSTFLAAVCVLVLVLLVLARVSSTMLSEAVESRDEPPDLSLTHSDEPMGNGDAEDTTVFDEPADPPSTARPPSQQPSSTDTPQLSTAALLANVVFTQGLFAGLLVALAWYTEIPPWAFGLSTDHVSAGAVGLGIGVGGVCYVLNEAAMRAGRRYGMTPPTALRKALAPETPAGWVVLFVVVLPVIAGFEELLFRGALIGVVHAGFEVPLWLLAIGSSVAFGLGHGAQGRVGILITGLLGVGLAGVFIWTGNLIVVIVAHYVINALEFAIHEWE